MRITVTVDVPDHASSLNHKVREALNAVRSQTVGDRLAPGSAGCVDDPEIGAIAVWEVTETSTEAVRRRIVAEDGPYA